MGQCDTFPLAGETGPGPLDGPGYPKARKALTMSDLISILVPATFAVPYPKGVRNGDESTFPVDVAAWSDEKHAAVYAFALKEYANNRAGGKDKSADDVIDSLTQDTFDAWVPATGSRGPRDETMFVAEMRLRLRTHLGVKTADVIENTKGFGRAEIIEYASRVIARRMGAAATTESVQRILDGHLSRIAAVLEARAADAGEPVID